MQPHPGYAEHKHRPEPISPMALAHYVATVLIGRMSTHDGNTSTLTQAIRIKRAAEDAAEYAAHQHTPMANTTELADWLVGRKHTPEHAESVTAVIYPVERHRWRNHPAGVRRAVFGRFALLSGEEPADVQALADGYNDFALHGLLSKYADFGAPHLETVRRACRVAAVHVLALPYDVPFHFERLADELAVLGFSDTASRSVTAVAHIAENRREKRQRAEADRRLRNAYGKPRRPKPQPQG